MADFHTSCGCVEFMSQLGIICSGHFLDDTFRCSIFWMKPSDIIFLPPSLIPAWISTAWLVHLQKHQQFSSSRLHNPFVRGLFYHDSKRESLLLLKIISVSSSLQENMAKIMQDIPRKHRKRWSVATEVEVWPESWTSSEDGGHGSLCMDFIHPVFLG